MIYTINFENKIYELKKRTLEMAQMIPKAVDTEIAIKDMYDAQMKFCVGALGKDVANELLGTTSVMTVDTAALTLLFSHCTEAYTAPIDEFQKNVAMSQIDEDTISMIDKVSAMADSADRITKAEKSIR